MIIEEWEDELMEKPLDIGGTVTEDIQTRAEPEPRI